jgi:hypothetical protein
LIFVIFKGRSQRMSHHWHWGHLTDALIQSDLKEQLWLSALLSGTSTYFSHSQLWDSDERSVRY